MNKALKDLLSIGRENKEVKVAGVKWKLHTLNAEEQLAATDSTGDYDNLTRVMALKIAILSRALESVNGEPLGNVGETRDALNKMQFSIVNKLFDEYDKMITNQEKVLTDLDNESEETEEKVVEQK